MFRFIKKHFGFTIIQLVIAMVIFAILTSIAFYGGSVYVNQGRETDAIDTLHSYESSLESIISYNKGKCVKGSEMVSASEITYDSNHKPVYTGGADWLPKVLTISDANRYLDDSHKILPASSGGDFCGYSECEDEWGSPYHFYISFENREPSIYKECYVSVVCLGKDRQEGTDDDIMLLYRYADGLLESQVVTNHAYTGTETYPMPQAD